MHGLEARAPGLESGFCRLLCDHGKLLNLSVPQFSHLSNGDDDSTCFVEFFEILNKLVL